MSDVKAWTLLCLCALCSLMIFAGAIANAQTFNVMSPVPVDCGLKKMNGRAWDSVDSSSVAGKEIKVEKEFPATNTVLFKWDNAWHAISKRCLNAPAGSSPIVEMTPVPNESPTPAPDTVASTNVDLSSLKRTSKFWALGYRQDRVTLKGASIELPLNETWIGIMYGFQKHYPLSRKLEWKWGGDVEVGMGSVKEDPSVSSQVTYSVSAVSVFGVRALLGISYRLGEKWILSFSPALLMRYGPYPVPTGSSSITIPGFNIDTMVGLQQDYNMNPKWSLHLEEGVVTKSSSLYIVGGIGLKVW